MSAPAAAQDAMRRTARAAPRPVKYGDGDEAPPTKRARVSEALGEPPFSEADLEAFRNAWQAHGEDWQAVSALLPLRTAAQCAALADVPGVRAALEADAAVPGAVLAALLAEAAPPRAGSREPNGSAADGDAAGTGGGGGGPASSGETGPLPAAADAAPAAAIPRVVGRRTPLQRRGPPASLSAGATAAVLVAMSPGAPPAPAGASQGGANPGPAPPSGARRGANSASSGGEREARPERASGRPPLPPGAVMGGTAARAQAALASPRRAPLADASPGGASPGGAGVGGRKRVRNLFGSRKEASAHDALLMMSHAASPASASHERTPGGARRASGGAGGARRGRVGFARSRHRKPQPEAPPASAMAGGATPSGGAGGGGVGGSGAREGGGGGSYVFRYDAAAAAEDAPLLLPPPPPPPSAAEALAAALRGAGSGDGCVATAADAAAAAARVASALQRCSRARRWARCEWHHPPLDAPYFARSDFREWLHHAGLDGVTRLARRDWRAVRAPLGAPRRLSLAFLRAEREALELQRAASRDAYARLQRAGGLGVPSATHSFGPGSLCANLPPDVPMPLSVGARVLAVHPRSRAVAAGVVLTVEPARLRVQFDRLDLGVEFCADTDVAPLRPGAAPASHYAAAAAAAAGGRADSGAADPLPASMAAMTADDDVAWAAGVMASGGRGRGGPGGPGGSAQRGTPSARALYGDAPYGGRVVRPSPQQLRHHQAGPTPPFAPASPRASRAAEAAAAAAAQRTELAAVMASLSLALDRKEALLSELRQMNAEAVAMAAQRAAAPPGAGGLAPGADDAFARAYAEVVLALKDANAAVEAGLTRLRGGGGGGAHPQAGAAASTPAGRAPGGRDAAARLVADAAADARGLVAAAAVAAEAEACVPASPTPPLLLAQRPTTGAPAAGGLVGAAVAALLVVRALADAPGALPADDVAAALQAAAAALRPRAAANGPLFDALRASLAELTQQLTTVYAAVEK